MKKSAILEEKPSTPIEMILQTEPGAMEFYQGIYTRLCQAMKNFDYIQFHQMRLGRQHFCWTGVHRYWIWDFPPLRLFVNNKKGIVVEVDPNLTVDEALNAFGLYEEVMGITYQPTIRPSEEFRLWWQGREAVKGHEMKIPRMKDKELRQFVLRFSDGHIWTSRHVRDMGMVFLPVALGCLSMPDKVQAKVFKGLMDNPGLEPTLPDKPKMGKLPVKPVKPEEPEYPQEDPHVIEEITSDIEWEDKTEEAIDDYKTLIKQKNDELRADYEAAVRAWEVACKDIEAQIERMKEDHEVKLRDWEKVNSEYFDKHAKWTVERARWEAVTRGVGEQWLKDLGCVWADEEKHNHPRGRYINGCPSFMECCLMHREDFFRAMDAAKLEMERREKIKV